MRAHDYYGYKENIRHGTVEFPIELYHSRGLIAPYHWHDEYEFVYMNEGSVCCRIGAEIFDLGQGQCAFVKGGALHSLTAEAKTDFDFHAVVFHPSLVLGDMDICKRYFSDEYIIQNRFSPGNEKESAVIDAVKLLRDTFESKSFGYELRVKSHLLLIFSRIFESGLYRTDMPARSKNLSERLEKVIKYIHKNFHTGLTVKDLADISGYSVSHFTRFFRELAGKTPMEYVIRLRIYNACDMLRHTDKSVLDISLDCGFENVGHFIKTFRRHMNITPYQYKKYRTRQSDTRQKR